MCVCVCVSLSVCVCVCVSSSGCDDIIGRDISECAGGKIEGMGCRHEMNDIGGR